MKECAESRNSHESKFLRYQRNASFASIFPGGSRDPRIFKL